MEEYLKSIDSLESQLTGDFFSDLDIQQQIYDVKKQMAEMLGTTVDEVEEDFDLDCLSCGS
jgi:hypothetical protein